MAAFNLLPSPTQRGPPPNPFYPQPPSLVSPLQQPIPVSKKETKAEAEARQLQQENLAKLADLRRQYEECFAVIQSTLFYTKFNHRVPDDPGRESSESLRDPQDLHLSQVQYCLHLNGIVT